MDDLAAAKSQATNLRKRTRDIQTIELCDLILRLQGAPKTSKLDIVNQAAAKVGKSPDCPVCAAHRAAKAKAQKAWRAKAKE